MKGERYLLDTNIVLYLALDIESLSSDVLEILKEPNATFLVSAESVKEMIVAYRNKGLGSDVWSSPERMIKAIENEFYIKICPLTKEVMLTYARMELNEAQGHKDPSDHVIIAQAITEHLPLISSDTRFEFYRKQGLDLIFNKR